MARKAEHQMFSKIRQWQVSRVSQIDFCKKKSITYATFHYCYKKFRDNEPSEEVVPSFVPVTITDTVGSTFCSVRLLDGIVIDFHNPVSPDYLNQLGK
ncbi:MAG: IS66 family insertion sequence element accessory protein TnpA [Pseudomonadota bacterium]